MKTKNWKIYGLWILLTEAVGALSGWLSREGMQVYNEMAAKPALAPPGWVFPVVWTVLYGLMGIGAARIYLAPASKERSTALNIYIAQLVVNFFWSLLFFSTQAFGFALIWLILLWVLIVGMVLAFRKVDPVAAWLQIPYLLWVTFAAYLNCAVWLLNR